MATSTDGILMGTLPVSPPRAASNLLSQGVEWRFVVLEKGQPVLHTLKLEPNQTGETVMRLLRQKCKVNKAIGNWFHASVKLEDAIISPVSNPPHSPHLLQLTTDTCSGVSGTQSFRTTPAKSLSRVASLVPTSQKPSITPKSSREPTSPV
jgi:hypothetical protein